MRIEDQALCENEIISMWQHGSIDKPIVSVCCTTYNHEKYVKDMLNGILMQQTSYSYELLIHDDASTDSTKDIIRDFELRYPRIIRPIYQIENQYRQNIQINTRFNFSRALGQYIAICEGDDYWCDNGKLERQVSLLKDHPEYHLSIHSAFQMNMLKESETSIISRLAEKDDFIDYADILSGVDALPVTAASVISRKAMKALKRYMEATPSLVFCDVFTRYISAYKRGAIYIDKPMSVYRIYSEGSHTYRCLKDNNLQARECFYFIKAYIELDTYTEYGYTDTLSCLIMDRLVRLVIALKKNQNALGQEIERHTLKMFNEELEKLKHLGPVVLYGASSVTKWMIDNFPEIKIEFILDRNKDLSGSDFCGYPIKHTEELLGFTGKLLIPLWERANKIMNDLSDQFGISPENRIVLNHRNMLDYSYLSELDDTIYAL